MKLSKDEQETHISQSAVNKDTWEIYTDNPSMISLFKRKHYVITKTTNVGVYFKVPTDYIFFKSLTAAKKRQFLKDENF